MKSGTQNMPTFYGDSDGLGSDTNKKVEDLKRSTFHRMSFYLKNDPASSDIGSQYEVVDKPHRDAYKRATPRVMESAVKVLAEMRQNTFDKLVRDIYGEKAFVETAEELEHEEKLEE
ncbi:MAG: hypothetical protein Q9218_004268 [Villophora microphyllina]